MRASDTMAGALGRSTAAVLCLFLVFCAHSARAGPALLFEPETGAVLHAYEPFQRWHPASLTKLMTLYLVFDKVEQGEASLEAPVQMSQRAVSVTANSMGWPGGTEIALDETIPILITKSANDIAVAVAEAMSGSVEAFVAEMNATAAALGMRDTRFVNPHGLHDPGQYTTARDVALLARRLIARFPDHLSRFAVAEGEARGVRFESHNRLLGHFPGADGLKTGFVCSSGWNIAASATRGGRRLVAIVLGALREGEREAVAGELIEAGFAGRLKASGRRLDTLARPAAAADPIDMRAYACGEATPPLAIASFGLSPAPLPRPRPVGE